MKMTKKQIKELKKKLTFEPKPAMEVLGDQATKKLFDFAESYRTFLTNAKTERIAARLIGESAKKAGLANLDDPKPKKKPKGWYRVYRNKTAILFKPGKEPLSKGANIVASHVDSPRLDLKGNPLYEQFSMAFMRTHYYGGIKKYQWVTVPLALHGVIVKSDGSVLEIAVGESEGDPVFSVQDLLPHLARQGQLTKKASDFIHPEKLTLLVGGIGLSAENDQKDLVKLAVLELLHDKYGIVEEDFSSAELCAVPAGPAADVGFDRAFLGGYGHDDRVCAYTALQALLKARQTKRAKIAVFYDKEEIGSDGDTGAQGKLLDEATTAFLDAMGESSTETAVRRCLYESKVVSADVTAGIDPNWPDVHEKTNAAKIGYGINISKYTGSRGKLAANDASAEFVGEIRRIFNAEGVPWQAGEMGKIDEGGGGTVAKYLAKLGCRVIDAGPALLSMHSPFEIAHKADVYSTFLAYKAFFEKA